MWMHVRISIVKMSIWIHHIWMTHVWIGCHVRTHCPPADEGGDGKGETELLGGIVFVLYELFILLALYELLILLGTCA